MKVVITQATQKEANDCWHRISLAIIEVFDDLYIVVQTKKITGWFDKVETNTQEADNLVDAIKIYKEWGGQIPC